VAPLRGVTIGGLSRCLHSPDLSCDLMAAPARRAAVSKWTISCMDSAAVNPAPSLSSRRRVVRVARVVVLAPLVVAVGMLGTAVRTADEGAEQAEFPVAQSYLRGVNEVTFSWFAGYGDKAGNE
jgi:hypothetical protein